MTNWKVLEKHNETLVFFNAIALCPSVVSGVFLAFDAYDDATGRQIWHVVPTLHWLFNSMRPL